LHEKNHKNPIKDRWSEPSHGGQKGKAKERPKDAQLAGTKKRNQTCMIPSFEINVEH